MQKHAAGDADEHGDQRHRHRSRHKADERGGGDQSEWNTGHHSDEATGHGVEAVIDGEFLARRQGHGSRDHDGTEDPCGGNVQVAQQRPESCRPRGHDDPPRTN